MNLFFMAEHVLALREQAHANAKNIESKYIADYFQNVRSWLHTKGTTTETPAPWHHCPVGHDLMTQILTRGPTIVDLYPEPDDNFERRVNISTENFKISRVGDDHSGYIHSR